MVAESKVKYTETDFADIPVKVVEKKKNQGENWRERLQTYTEQERFWAAAAHAMGPLMIFSIFVFDGMFWMFLLAVTGGIYLYHRDKSPLVKHHARQALAAQALGTFGWFILVVVGALAWAVLLVVSILLILLLVGLILTPLVAVLGPLAFLASFLLPLGVALFGTIGAWEAWHERDFRYPYLADWLERRFDGNTKAKREIITLV